MPPLVVRQLAVYYADHDEQLGDALAIAQGSLEVRNYVYGYDTLEPRRDRASTA